MLATAALMLLLLPLALLCTSLERRAGIGLALTGTEATMPDDGGTLEALRVERTASGFKILADVRSTDIRAHAGDVEQQSFQADTLTDLGTIAGKMKLLDPNHKRATLVPLPTSKTAEVVRWMDVLRGTVSSPLFPDIILETQR